MAKATRHSTGIHNRSRSKAAGWKKSKPLMYGLVVFISILWIAWILPILSGSKADGIAIPTAYWDEATNSLYVHQTAIPNVGFPPYRHPVTGEKTLWDAYTCTNEKCKDPNDPSRQIIFPLKLIIPDQFRNAIAEMEAGDRTDASEEELSNWMETRRDIDAEMELRRMAAQKCPLCGATDTVKPYLTPEAEKIFEELRRKAEGKRQ